MGGMPSYTRSGRVGRGGAAHRSVRECPRGPSCLATGREAIIPHPCVFSTQHHQGNMSGRGADDARGRSRRSRAARAASRRVPRRPALPARAAQPFRRLAWGPDGGPRSGSRGRAVISCGAANPGHRLCDKSGKTLCSWIGNSI